MKKNVVKSQTVKKSHTLKLLSLPFYSFIDYYQVSIFQIIKYCNWDIKIQTNLPK